MTTPWKLLSYREQRLRTWARHLLRMPNDGMGRVTLATLAGVVWARGNLRRACGRGGLIASVPDTTRGVPDATRARVNELLGLLTSLAASLRRQDDADVTSMITQAYQLVRELAEVEKSVAPPP